MIRHLYFLRHGEADHDGTPTWSHDSQRPLTRHGKEKMALQAAAMRRSGLEIEAIVTSPYKRARQTAEIVAAAYHLEDRLVESDLLGPGAAFKDLVKTLRTVTATHVLVVGHAPDLGEWTGELLGGDPIALGKGWLAWVRLEGEMENGGGRLKALLPADWMQSVGRLLTG
jgi:phosphohistidine phosphatase